MQKNYEGKNMFNFENYKALIEKAGAAAKASETAADANEDLEALSESAAVKNKEGVRSHATVSWL